MGRSVFLSVLFVACDGAPAIDAGVDAGEPLPPRVCMPGGGWDPGDPAFEDRTADWGLDGLDGYSLAVGDVDGDGLSDLVLNAPSPYDRTPGHVFLNQGGETFVEHDSGLYRVRGSDEDGRSTSMIRFGDVDNDGDLDAFAGVFMYLTDSAREPLDDVSEILLNDGSGNFTLTETTTVIPTEEDPLTSDGFFFDQNLDGVLDLAVGFWWAQPAWTVPFGLNPQLFRGAGDGTFADVTEEVGMLLPRHDFAFLAGRAPRPLFGLVMCDLNDDHRMDLVGAAYARMFNEVFVAEGDSFVEIGRNSVIGSDDRRDYTDDESFRCYCRDNPTAPMCAGLPAPRIVCPGRGWQPGYSDQPRALGGNTFSYACGDFDNDGDFDLYESNIRHPDVGSSSDPSEVLVNESAGGEIVFTRPGRETMGLVPPIDLGTTDEGGQHNAAFDFDNDGRLDLLLAGSPYERNRGWLFHQRREGTLSFEWIGEGAGFYHACALGSAIADFDRDGDLDLVVGSYGCNGGADPDYTPPEDQPVRFYENVSTENNWIAIRLIGRGAGGSNRQGLGARVSVTTPDGVTQTQLVRTNSQNAMFEAEAHFGLGEHCDVERVDVRWPDAAGTTQTFADVLANYRVEIAEGDDRVRYPGE